MTACVLRNDRQGPSGGAEDAAGHGETSETSQFQKDQEVQQPAPKSIARRNAAANVPTSVGNAYKSLLSSSL